MILISCRFVPHDQWIVTHVDPSSSIRHIKHSLLARCIHSTPAPYRPSSPITFAPYPPPQRPISPITFANPVDFHRTRPSLSSQSHSDSDTDPQSSQDSPLTVTIDRDSPYSSQVQDPSSTPSSIYHNNRIPRRSSSPLQPPPLPAPEPPDSPIQDPSPEEAHILSQFALIRFSTGQVLEDDFQVTWYSIRPHELLEIHHVGVILRLPRASASEYALPYFEAQVRVLALAGPSGPFYTEDDKRHARSSPEDEKKSRAKDKDKKIKQKDPDAPAKLERARTKRHKLDWKGKWLVIRDGVVHVCRDQHDTNPQRYHLSSLVTLRGAEQLVGTNIVLPLPQRVICAEFRHNIPIPPHTKESSKGKNPEKKRPLSPVLVSVNASTPSTNIEDIDGDSCPPVFVKKSILRQSRSRDAELPALRSPGQFSRGDRESVKGKSRTLKHASVVMSNQTSSIVSWSNTSSPTDSSFVLPGDSQKSISGSVEDVRSMVDDEDNESGMNGLGEGEDEEGEWVVLDMLNDGAFNNILRILHRHFPPPISSSFLPTVLPIGSPMSTPYYTPLPSPTVLSTLLPSPLLDLGSPDVIQHNTRPSRGGSSHRNLYALPYPEWRIVLVERAQRAGVGHVSPALGLFLWGQYDGLMLRPDEPLSVNKSEESSVVIEPTLALGDIDDIVSGGTLREEDAVTGSGEDADEDGNVDDAREVLNSNSNEEHSEAEWEGWTGDLGRQQERWITRDCGYNSGCSGSIPENLGSYRDPPSYAHGEPDVHTQRPVVVTQRLTQEGRRALEPSAIVTRMSPTSARLRASTMATAVSSSTVSVSSGLTTMDGKSTELPNGVTSFGGYSEMYRVPLRTKMSIEEVLETANSGPAVAGTGECLGAEADLQQSGIDVGIDVRRVVDSSPVRASSIRKRSATSAGPISLTESHMDASGDGPGPSSLEFSARKGKSKDKDKWSQASLKSASKDQEKGTAGRDGEKLSILNPSSATEPMASSTSLSSDIQTRDRVSTSESGSLRSRSRVSILRHVRSGSSLYDSVGESTAGGGGRKGGRLGLIRGVSARAGRFVKGLDAALDFVDAR